MPNVDVFVLFVIFDVRDDERDDRPGQANG